MAMIMKSQRRFGRVRKGASGDQWESVGVAKIQSPPPGAEPFRRWVSGHLLSSSIPARTF